MDETCRIELLGGLCMRKGDKVNTPFRTQKAGALLAYLACFSQRSHGREELIEWLWPDSDISAGRSNLRAELSGLRKQFARLDIPPSQALIADHSTVGLNPAVCITDVGEFESALQLARQSKDPARCLAALTSAVEMYRGKLLPGYYDDRILSEQERLANVYREALRRLVERLQGARDYDRAGHYAHRMVEDDPLCEESHRLLMRLYAAAGRPDSALNHYKQLEQTLQKELETPPEEESIQLAAEIRQQLDASAARQKSRRPRLPHLRTRFFGRDEETEALIALLKPATRAVPDTSPTSPPDACLVTLTGPGGSGKTRLAIEVASKLTAEFDGAVWFVSLADITDGRLVADAVLEALAVQRSATLTPLEQMIVFLNRQPFSLLVLDNCEHLLAEASRIVLALQTRVSGLSCLVTSRRRLALAGEHECAVTPLPVPETADVKDRLMRIASVQLFVDRAVAAFQPFQLRPDNAVAVAQLCVRLEGIPLAIELAAARVGQFTPAQMLERISARFELLASTSADHPERHRSLWAALDWSFELLTPELQRLFARLSVFRGGCTTEAAEAVCECPHASEYLTQLRSHSLVTAEEACGEMRTVLLETLREYGWEQLNQAERIPLQNRHADYFLIWAQEAGAGLHTSQQTVCLTRLDREHDNLRAALKWCQIAADSCEKGLRLAGALGEFWHLRGHYTEGREWLDQMVTQSETTELIQAQALKAAGVLAWDQGDYAAARSLLDTSLHLYRKLDHPQGVAKTLQDLGNVAADQNDFLTAGQLYVESLEICEQLDNEVEIAWALNRVATIAHIQQDNAHACTLYEQSLAILRRLNFPERQAWTLLNLGSLHLAASDYTAAHRAFEEGMALFQQLSDPRGTAAAFVCVGEVAYAQGDFSIAQLYFEQSLTSFRDIGHKLGIVRALRCLAELAFCQGDNDRAYKLYIDGLKVRCEIGDQSGIGHILLRLAQLAARTERLKRASTLFGAAEAQYETMGRSKAFDDCSEMAIQLNVPNHDTFTKAWIQGRSLTLEQAVAYAMT